MHTNSDVAGHNYNHEDYEKNFAELQEEYQRSTVRSSVVKPLLKETFDGRRHWIIVDSPSISEVVSVFPSLKVEKHASFFTIMITYLVQSA